MSLREDITHEAEDQAFEERTALTSASEEALAPDSAQETFDIESEEADLAESLPTIVASAENAEDEALEPSDEEAAPNAAAPEGQAALSAAERLQQRRARRAEERADAHPKKSEEPVNIGKHTINYGILFKFLGLLAFLALMALICYLIWPTISMIFEEGGAEQLVENIRSAGPLGVLMLLGLQFVQIVVAFIPGEVVQVAAGMMYGPWLGTLVVIVGCVFSSAFIYWLVHKLGAPFVQAMVPDRFFERVKDFENSGKLNVIVFVLFLIPGLPKDTFTYLVPLTNMRMRDFLVISNVARIPGVFLSAYAADDLMEGNFLRSALLFLIAAALACLGIYGCKKYLDFKRAKEDPEGARIAKEQQEAKKAERRAKRAKRRARNARRKAAKQAKAYEEYKQAAARVRQHHAENAQVEEHVQAYEQQQKDASRWARYRAQAREQDAQSRAREQQSAPQVVAQQVSEPQPAVQQPQRRTRRQAPIETQEQKAAAMREAQSEPPRNA